MVLQFAPIAFLHAASPSILGVIITILLRMTIYLFSKYKSFKDAARQKKQADGNNESAKIEFDWKGLVVPFVSLTRKAKNRSLFPFVHMTLPHQKTKLVVYINEFGVHSIGNFFQLLLSSSPVDLVFHKICFGASFCVLDQDGHVLLSTNIFFKIDQIKAVLNFSKIWRFVIVAPLQQLYQKLRFTLTKSDSSPESLVSKADKLNRMKILPAFLQSISLKGFSISIQISEQQNKHTDTLHGKYTTHACISFDEFSSHFSTKASTTSLASESKPNLHETSHQLSKYNVHISICLDGLQFKAATNLVSVENINETNLSCEIAEDFEPLDLTVKLPRIIGDIDLNASQSIPSNSHATDTNEKNSEDNNNGFISAKIDINAHDSRITPQNARYAGDSLQISVGIQELAQLLYFTQRIVLFRQVHGDLLHKNGKKDINSANSNHFLQPEQESIAQNNSSIPIKKKKMSLDQFSFRIGIIISIYNNATNSKFDTDQNFTDENSLKLTNSTVWEIGTNEVCVTLSDHYTQDESDENNGKSDLFLIAQIPDLFFLRCDSSNNLMKIIDIVRVDKITFESVLDKPLQDIVSSRVNIDDIAVMVDTTVIEEMERVAKEIQKRSTSNQEQDIKKSMTSKSSSERNGKTNTNKIKSFEFFIRSTNLFYVDLIGANTALSIPSDLSSPAMCHVKLTNTSISLVPFKTNLSVKRVCDIILPISTIVISTQFPDILNELERPLSHKTGDTITYIATVYDSELFFSSSLKSKKKKKQDVSIAMGKILVDEWRGDSIEIHSKSVRIFTSLLLKQLQEESNHDQFERCIASDGFDVSIREDTYLNGTTTDIQFKPTEVIWSPIFQLSFKAVDKSFSVLKNRVKNISQGNSQSLSIKKGPKPNHIIMKGNTIFVHFHLGASSRIDFITEQIEIDIEKNMPGLGTKPNVSCAFGRTQVTMNDCYPPFISFDSLIFRDTFVLARNKDILSYEAKISEQLQTSKFDNTLVSNANDHPLHEIIDLQIGNLTARVSPSLEFGVVLNDILLTPKILEKAFFVAEFSQKKQKKIRFQLMSINSSIERLNISLLEHASSSKGSTQEIPTQFLSISDTPPKFDECFKSVDESESDVNVLSMFLHGIDLNIERNTPPSATQSHLSQLDPDPNTSIIYGPKVQGGFMTLTMAHMLVILNPLDLVTPLAVIQNFKWKGDFFMTELSPESPNLLPGYNYLVPLGCSHAKCHSSHEIGPCCNYGVQIHARGVPTKFYVDGSFTTDELSMSWGPQVQESIPILMNIIRRIQPPRPPTDLPPPPPLAWWDNLRFLFHGKVDLSCQSFKFRWLLDTVDEPDWSILVRCSDFSLSYNLSNLKLRLYNLSMSLPIDPYPTDSKARKRMHKQKRYKIMCSSEERQSLLLIPALQLDLGFNWLVGFPNLFSPMKHHCPYMILQEVGNLSDESKNKIISTDKFHGFRSCGVNYKLKATVQDSQSFSNWIAMRIETLPWITHRYVNPMVEKIQMNQVNVDPENPGPLPKIESISVNINVHETRIALWYGVLDTSGLCIKVPCMKVNFEASRKNPNREKLTSTSTSIEVGGEMQGALLDVMNSDVRNEGNTEAHDSETDLDAIKDTAKIYFDDKLSNDPVSYQETEFFDHFCGSFGKEKVENRFTPIRSKCHHSRFHHNKRIDDSFFNMLQKWSGKLSPLDYIIQANNLIIVDTYKPLEESTTGENEFVFPGSHHSTPRSKWQSDTRGTQVNEATNRRTQIHWPNNNINNSDSDLDSESESESDCLNNSYNGQEEIRSWSVLVTGLKLLWTLEIRDVMLALIGNHLLETINFMVVQLKENMPLKETDDLIDSDTERKTMLESYLNESNELFVDSTKNKLTNNKSSLMYLLRGSTAWKKKSRNQDEAMSDIESESEANTSVDSEEKESVPIVDIHLFNPQIQLHSHSTGGSIILAMKGATVEGRRFIKLYYDEKRSRDFSIENLLRKLEFKYALDSVQGYSVVNDVEVDIGLQWLDLIPEFDDDNVCNEDANFKTSDQIRTLRDLMVTNRQKSMLIPALNVNLLEDDDFRKTFRHTPMEFSVPYLFKQIFYPFNFRTRQEFFLAPSDLSESELMDYCARLSYLVLGGPATDHLEVWIDELSFVLDAKQFSTTSDLIRNVLLAPLPIELTKKKRKDSNPENEGNTEEATTEASVEPSQNSEWSNHEVNVNNLFSQWQNSKQDIIKEKNGRYALREATRKLLSKVEASENEMGNATIRCIVWNLSKAKWKIRADTYLDDVEINFTELHGRHEFSSTGSVVSTIELEDLGAINLKPSPDSINFYDATSVVSTVLGDDRSPCQRCGAIFHQCRNEIGSCRYHSDAFGVPGTFCLNQITGKRQWSCCGAVWQRTPGCRSRPHTGTERALMIRLEGLPKVVDRITLYKHMEVNIFPSVNHTLKIQVTKRIADLFMDYFMGDNREDISEVNSTYSDSNKSDPTIPSTRPFFIERFDSDISDLTFLESLPEMRKKKNLLFGVSDDGVPRKRLMSTDHKNPPLSTTKEQEIESLDNTDAADKVQKQDVFFIKHWRIGHINIEVSLLGFQWDVSNFFLSVAAFPRSYKIGHAPYLSQKYMNYLIHELIKSATSSGFRKMFLEEKPPEQNASNHDTSKRDGNTMAGESQKSLIDDDSAKMNLLFGTPRRNRRNK